MINKCLNEQYLTSIYLSMSTRPYVCVQDGNTNNDPLQEVNK